MLAVDDTNYTKPYYPAVFPLRGLAVIAESKLFSDVVLQVGETKIPCHKLILMAWSSKLFELSMGKSEVVVPVPEEKHPLFIKVINYLYTGCIEWKREELEDLLLMANEFNIRQLVEHVGTKLAEVVSDSTLTHLLELVRITNCKTLSDACGGFLAVNFRELCEGTSLYEMDPYVVAGMLKAPLLHVRNELEVVNFVRQYINKRLAQGGDVGKGKEKEGSDPKGKGKEKEVPAELTRKGLLAILAPSIKFPRMTPTTLVTLETDPEFESEDVERLIHYAFKMKALPEYYQKEKKKWLDKYEENPEVFKASPHYWYYLQLSPRKYLVDCPSFTLDPSKKGSTATLSNNNLTMTSTGRAVCLGTISFTEGKHYWEVKVDKSGGNSYVILGIAPKTYTSFDSDLGGSAAGIGWFTDSTTIYGKATGTTKKNVPVGGRAGMLLDLDKNKLVYFSNGEEVGQVAVPHDEYYPAFDTYMSVSQITLIEDPELPEDAQKYLED